MALIYEKGTNYNEKGGKMDDKMFDDLKDLRFTMTNKMQEILTHLLFLKQALENEKLSFRERKLMQKEFDNLLKSFRKEFQVNNPVQVQIMRSYLNIK